MKFLATAVQKLWHEQTDTQKHRQTHRSRDRHTGRQTDRPEWNYYLSAYADGNIVSSRSGWRNKKALYICPNYGLPQWSLWHFIFPKNICLLCSSHFSFILIINFVNKKPEGFMQGCNILLRKNRTSRLVPSLVRLCEISLNRLV